MESGENPVEDGLDSASTFQDAKHPTGKTVLNLGILELRITGRKDPLDRETELLKERGFVMSGLRKMLEDPDVYRAYFVKQLPVEVDEEQTTEPKIESEIAKRLASRRAEKLAKESVVTQAEAKFRQHASSLSYPEDFETNLVNHDEHKFLCERNGDDWAMMVLSRDTTRRGSFRQAADIIRTGLLEVPLRGALRDLNYEHDDNVTDYDGRCEVTCHLKPEHQKRLNELWSLAWQARRDYAFRNPRLPLPPEVRGDRFA
jgi:hypothetical protein